MEQTFKDSIINNKNDIMDKGKIKKVKKTKSFSIKKVVFSSLFIVALVIVAFDAMGLVHIFVFNNILSIVSYNKLELVAGSQVHTTSDGIFIANRSYISFIDKNRNEIFRHYYSMINPVITARGSYVAVIENFGHIVHVYNTNGLVYTVDMGHSISSFSLSKNGYIALIAYNMGGYDIQVHNAHGMPFYGRHVDSFVSPVAVDISPDGIYIAISYIDINDAIVNSIIKFIHLDSNRLTYENVDGVFAVSMYNPNQIIGKIHFVDNTRLVAISSSRIFMVEPHNNANISWEIKLNNRINSISIENNWFAVAYGSAFINHLGHEAGSINVYNMHGQKIFSPPLKHAQNMHSYQDLLLVNNLYGFNIYNINNQNLVIQEIYAGDNFKLLGNDAILEILGTNARILHIGP